ncbi:MAG: LysR family transcriptional regulator [Kofleriaceae bacterium]|nr:LysR family transcriptional regulator [Kofleriaceae bacterium]
MVANIEAPDLNDVALFVDVVRAASFTAAAKQRGVPVSTVSRRIARLEARLDTRLLERTTRRLHLTDVGRTYFEHAARALDELGEGSQHVRAFHAAPHGRVRITAPVGLGPLVTSLLASYLRDAPDVTIELDLAERRVDLIAEGFDIAVRTGPSDSADLVARKIFESARYLFASSAYLARRGRPTRLDDLAAHDLIATQSSASGTSWELFNGKRRHRLAFKPRLVVNELQAARAAALAGIGIALLPTAVTGIDGLVRVLPRISAAAGGLWVLYPSRRALTAAVRTCVDHLVRELTALSAH